MMRVIVLAPIHNSLYSRLVANALLREKGIELCGIIVRTHWSLNRLHSEFHRDGIRLIRKTIQKFFLGDRRFSQESANNLAIYAKKMELGFQSLKQLAVSSGTPYVTVKNHNTVKSQRFLKKFEPDLIVFTGGGLIKPEILKIPKKGVLNCHSGILPEFRGMDVVEWTAAEDKMKSVGFGASLHFMDQGIDTGPILIRKILEIEPEDTFQTIRDRLEVVMIELIQEGIRNLRDSKIECQSQEAQHGRQYFVMHPRILEYAERNLRAITSHLV